VDGAWLYLKRHLPVFTVGKLQKVAKVINDILYTLKTGSQRRVAWTVRVSNAPPFLVPSVNNINF
jgi:hypothetical protein